MKISRIPKKRRLYFHFDGRPRSFIEGPSRTPTYTILLIGWWRIEWLSKESL